MALPVYLPDLLSASGEPYSTAAAGGAGVSLLMVGAAALVNCFLVLALAPRRGLAVLWTLLLGGWVPMASHTDVSVFGGRQLAGGFAGWSAVGLPLLQLTAFREPSWVARRAPATTALAATAAWITVVPRRKVRRAMGL
ncbi:MAG TPA: hypothetical protein VKA84_01065 [Gemmatimonadaceae bacterium]|nr:hypothetical protein [Gemmatimonadaceae bacterium]